MDRISEVLFCLDQMVDNKVQIDPDFWPESAAVHDLRLPYSLFDFDLAVEEGNFQGAIACVEPSEKLRTAILRSWMFSVEEYEKLYNALFSKGVKLINSPSEYSFCHWLPNSYGAIKHVTPTTTWISFPTDGLSQTEVDDALTFNYIHKIKELLRPFGKRPIVVKDYVKSAKYFWNKACFIPDASDTGNVLRILQGFNDVNCGFVGGLVFRQYVEFEPVKRHYHSRVAPAKEYRLFFLNGKQIASAQYWMGEYDEEAPEGFEEIAKNIPSTFFSMDVAKTKDGRWLVIEVGDGQVSSLPNDCDSKQFYRNLFGV